ncbi:MAG: RnfABCDGE type electron transport complex subunit A [Firmicutes bacterium]|nr:RnfABCDGE type electron transport complex subunit A [Bacillota bacterium]
MKEMIVIILTAVFVNNYVLQQFLGICPFLGVSKKIGPATGMSAAVVFVMILATAVTWPIQTFILEPAGMGYMQTVVFILLIASVVQLVEITLKRYMPSLHSALGVYLPLITTNCAVLAVCISNIDTGFTFLEAIFNALGSGLGFFLAMILFAGIRSRIEECDPPESFKGLPITLVSAAILSLSFFGFAGVIENLFA